MGGLPYKGEFFFFFYDFQCYLSETLKDLIYLGAFRKGLAPCPPAKKTKNQPCLEKKLLS